MTAVYRLKTLSVCTFKTSPCVPAPRPHAENHVRRRPGRAARCPPGPANPEFLTNEMSQPFTFVQDPEQFRSGDVTMAVSATSCLAFKHSCRKRGQPDALVASASMCFCSFQRLTSQSGFGIVRAWFISPLATTLKRRRWDPRSVRRRSRDREPALDDHVMA